MTDVFRFFAIAMIFVTIGSMIALMVEVEHFYRRINGGRWAWHIFGLGVPYCLFALAAAGELQSRLGSPATWRTPLYVAAAAVGLVTQIWMRLAWNHHADRFDRDNKAIGGNG